jgi:hypothetical protein
VAPQLLCGLGATVQAPNYASLRAAHTNFQFQLPRRFRSLRLDRTQIIWELTTLLTMGIGHYLSSEKNNKIAEAGAPGATA